MLQKTQVSRPAIAPRLGTRSLLPWGLTASLLLSASAWAAGSWQWIDEHGRKVFSDRPPPTSVPLQKIVKQPDLAPSAPQTMQPVDTAAQARPGATPSTDTPPKSDDTTGASKPRESDRAEQARRQELEQRNAALRAENCQRAQTSMSTLQSGVRLMTSNAQGEPVVMDDSQREQEYLRLQRALVDNCR